MAERAPVALLSSADAARIAVGEAITNLAAAPIGELGNIRLSANWMAAVDHAGEDAALFDAVRAVGMELCPQLDISIPVGKDSMSMQTVWDDPEAGEQRTVAPVSLVVTGFARVDDVRRSPDAAVAPGPWRNRPVADRPRRRSRPPRRLGVDAGLQPRRRRAAGPGRPEAPEGAVRPGAGSQCPGHGAGLSRPFRRRRHRHAAGNGLRRPLRPGDPARGLGRRHPARAVQRGTRRRAAGASCATRCVPGAARQARSGRPRPIASANRDEKLGIKLFMGTDVFAKWNWQEQFQAWSETSHAMQRLRDNPDCADAELEWRTDDNDRGIQPSLSFDPAEDIAAPMIATGERPRVAILREQGVNGQVEMAAAFDPRRVRGRRRAHVRPAGRTHRPGRFPGAGRLRRLLLWRRAGRRSRLGHDHPLQRAPAAAVRALLRRRHAFRAGRVQRLPDAVAPQGHHSRRRGTGRSSCATPPSSTRRAWPRWKCCRPTASSSRAWPVRAFRWWSRTARAAPTSLASAARPRATAACATSTIAARRPNATRSIPNGSPGGLTGFTAADGRVLIMMPHPERVFRSVQMSWRRRKLGRGFALDAHVPQRARLGRLSRTTVCL